MGEIIDRDVRIHHGDKLVLRAKVEAKLGEHEVAWKLLQEAHIFWQPFVAPHMYVHWEMLCLAIKERDFSEMLGQIIRFLLAGPASFFKTYPEGNTGRSDVGIFTSMPISKRMSDKIRELERLEKQRLGNNGIVKKYQRQFPLTRR